MLALRGIIIILGGLVFMFLPGVLVSLASQRGLRYNRARIWAHMATAAL